MRHLEIWGHQYLFRLDRHNNRNRYYVPEFPEGKRLICMDGLDLSEMLRMKLSFVDVMDAKVRMAAETGYPFVSVRDLFIG